MEVTTFLGSVKRYKFTTQYDPSIEADRQFTLLTPSGELTVLIDNPKVVEGLNIDEDYYIDITPVKG